MWSANLHVFLKRSGVLWMTIVLFRWEKSDCHNWLWGVWVKSPVTQLWVVCYIGCCGNLSHTVYYGKRPVCVNWNSKMNFVLTLVQIIKSYFVVKILTYGIYRDWLKKTHWEIFSGMTNDYSSEILAWYFIVLHVCLVSGCLASPLWPRRHWICWSHQQLEFTTGVLSWSGSARALWRYAICVHAWICVNLM